MSKQIEHVQFVSTLSKGRNFVRHCCRNLQHCCQKRQQCRTRFALKFRTFDKVERYFDTVAQHGNIVEATGNKVACCFDIVADVDGALVLNHSWSHSYYTKSWQDANSAGAKSLTVIVKFTFNDNVVNSGALCCFGCNFDSTVCWFSTPYYRVRNFADVVHCWNHL